MLNALIGFVSGIGISLIAAIIGAWVKRREDRIRRVQEVQFQVYMKLISLSNLYFWVASGELHGEDVDIELKRNIRDGAWQIADLLRFEEKVPHSEKIMRVLMSNEYPSAVDRHDAMINLVSVLGAYVNPHFQRISKEISNSNILRIGTGQRGIRESKTPGFMIF